MKECHYVISEAAKRTIEDAHLYCDMDMEYTAAMCLSSAIKVVYSYADKDALMSTAKELELTDLPEFMG